MTIITLSYREILIYRERREHGLAGLTRYVRYSHYSFQRLLCLLAETATPVPNRLGAMQWRIKEDTLP